MSGCSCKSHCKCCRRGATGASGASGGGGGATGATGPGGGATGPSGAQGIAGGPGGTGASGANGSAGDAGATGASGAQGIAGGPGATGASGANGSAGATGASGAAGSVGAAGATGASGAAGASGASGAAGGLGATGATGPQAPPHETLLQIFGSDLYRWMYSYSVATGWLDMITSTFATNPTPAKRPVLALLPSGRSCPYFNGAASAERWVSMGGIAALATWTTTQNYLAGGMFKFVSDPSGGFAFIVSSGAGGGFNQDSFVLGSGIAPFPGFGWASAEQNSTSTQSYLDGEWHSWLIQRDGATDTNTLYIDNVAQTLTSAVDMGINLRLGAMFFGVQEGVPTRMINGYEDQVFFAMRPAGSPITALERTRAHNALYAGVYGASWTP